MSGAGRGYRWEDPGREAERRADARCLTQAVWQDPCRGLARGELEADLGWGPRRFEQAMFYAWRSRWIEFIRDYLVAPPEAAPGFGVLRVVAARPATVAGAPAGRVNEIPRSGELALGITPCP